MRSDIKIVCAWCNEYMGREKGWGVQKVSYSICSNCLSDWHKLRSLGAGAQVKHAHEITSVTVSA